MSYLIKAIFSLLLALLMVFCCVINVINQDWFALVICIIALAMDNIATTILQYIMWLKNKWSQTN